MPVKNPTRGLFLLTALAIGACGGDDDPGDEGNHNAADFITSVSSNYEPPVAVARRSPRTDGRSKVPRVTLRSSSLRDPIEAVYHDGAHPATGGAGAATATENSTPLQGEPYRLSLTAGEDFSTVYVWIDGVEGYWELTIPSGVTAVELVLGLANNPPQSSFNLVTAVGSGGGVAATATTGLEPRDLSDADFAATVLWTGASDVDIHVFDPNGIEVYFGNTESPEGGKLDLDSNADCDLDNINTETISWPAGTAPDGDYTVVVEYFDDCDETSSSYTTLIRRKGRPTVTVGPRTFSGDYTANAPDTVGTYAFP